MVSRFTVFFPVSTRLVAVVLMVMESEVPGTPFGLQFVLVFQLVLVVPVQV
ncbi:MAG: hypothetical protein U0Y08_06125 [Bacteroidia bacterium]